MRQWRLKHPEKAKAQARKDMKTHRIKNKLLVLKHYSNNQLKCACCGETEYKFLSLDHIDNDGYKLRESTRKNIYDWLIKNGFPKGIQVLCMNCNSAKSWYGKCPHND